MKMERENRRKGILQKMKQSEKDTLFVNKKDEKHGMKRWESRTQNASNRDGLRQGRKFIDLNIQCSKRRRVRIMRERKRTRQEWKVLYNQNMRTKVSGKEEKYCYSNLAEGEGNKAGANGEIGGQ